MFTSSFGFWSRVEPEQVAECIADGVNMDMRGRRGATALHQAARQAESGGLLTLLINAGADVNAVDDYGNTPLHIAVRRSEKMDDVHATVMRLLDKSPIDRPLSARFLPAVLIASKLDVIATLLDAGASINMQNLSGYTPLHLAIDTDCRDTFPETVTMLLGYGADPNNYNIFGYTPVHSIVRRYYTSPIGVNVCGQTLSLIAGLVQVGADVNAFSNGDSSQNQSMTPLILATYYGWANAPVIELLKAGANVNLADEYGNTPLHYAVLSSGGQIDTIQILLDAGADVHATNNSGFGVLAVYERHEATRESEAFQLIIEEINAD